MGNRFSCMPVTPTPIFTYAEAELFNSDALKRRFSADGDLTWMQGKSENDILIKITNHLVEIAKSFMVSGLKCLGMVGFLTLTLLISTCIIFAALCFTYFLFIYCFYFLFIIPLGILGKITDKLGDIQKGRLQ